MVVTSTWRIWMNKVEIGLLILLYSVSPSINNVLVPQSPMSIDFNHTILETLRRMDMMHKPCSEKDTLMDSWPFYNSCSLQRINLILDRFWCFVQEMIGIFWIFEVFCRFFILTSIPRRWDIVKGIGGS